MKLLSLLLISLLLFNVPFAEAGVESGNWTASRNRVIAGLSGEINDGPFNSYVNATDYVIDISLTFENSTYRFHANVNGNKLSGTVFSSSSMGAFETPFTGQISGDGSQISIRPEWAWLYSGRKGRWVKNFQANTTWIFTR